MLEYGTASKSHTQQPACLIDSVYMYLARSTYNRKSDRVLVLIECWTLRGLRCTKSSETSVELRQVIES